MSLPKVKNKLAILAAFVLNGAVILAPVYANEPFSEFARAILRKATKLEVETLTAKYKGRELNGYAYVVSTSEDLSGEITVTLSTKKDFSALDTVNVVVFLRKYFAKQKLNIKPDQRVWFMGVFEEIRMNTIILKEGLVKQ